MNHDYYPGLGCQCMARSQEECACDVDWTPAEVYELRTRVEELEMEASDYCVQYQNALEQINDQTKHIAELTRVLVGTEVCLELLGHVSRDSLGHEEIKKVLRKG